MTDEQRLLSLSLRWSVCYVMRRCTKNGNKTPNSNNEPPTRCDQMQHPSAQRERAEGKRIVYRAHFKRLLSLPMSIRDKLVIELPTLQAFRSGEVSTLRAEHVDIENGDIQVLDSKKRQLFTLPLDPTVAEHIIQLNIHEGYLITGRKRTGLGLHVTHVERIWADRCIEAGVPVMSPRMGRAYKACSMIYGFSPTTGARRPKKSVVCVMHYLRHDNLQSTQHYVASPNLVYYEDFKAECQEGEESPFDGSECLLMDRCLGYEFGCHCRMFQRGRMFPEATINTEIKQP